MKVISIWQPFASLIVEGCKVFETRSWPAPKSVIGQRIGIASTKNIVPGQREHCADERFQRFFEGTGLISWDQLPRGYLLGTVILDSVEIMTSDLMDDVSDEEQSYGWWDVGFYAWRLRDPQKLIEPIPIQGKQGLYEWKGELGDVAGEVQQVQKDSEKIGSGWPNGKGSSGRHLRVV